MTEAEARAKLDALGTSAREALMDGAVAHLRWEPGNMTMYELMLVPWEATTEIEWEGRKPPMAWEGSPGWVYVIRFGLGQGKAYPLRIWELDGSAYIPDADYCAEKWGSGFPDGAAIQLLLSAIAGIEPLSTFEDARCMFEAAA